MKIQGQYEDIDFNVQFKNLNNTGQQIKTMFKQELKILNDIKIYLYDENQQQKFELDLNLPLNNQFKHGNYQIFIENINPIQVESQIPQLYYNNQKLNSKDPQLVESVFQSVQNEKQFVESGIQSVQNEKQFVESVFQSVQNENQQITSEIQVDLEQDEIIEDYDERITLLQTYIKQSNQQISEMKQERTKLLAETENKEKQLYEDALAQYQTINYYVADQNAQIEQMYLNIHIIEWSPKEQQASYLEKMKEEQKNESKQFKEIEYDIEQEQQKQKKLKETMKELKEKNESLTKQIEDSETQVNKKVKLNQ